MTRPRKSEMWSRHTDVPNPPAPGSPFLGVGVNGTLTRSCCRCGIHRSIDQMEADKHPLFKHQKRCIDREICATARGGKS